MTVVPWVSAMPASVMLPLIATILKSLLIDGISAPLARDVAVVRSLRCVPGLMQVTGASIVQTL
jgi:hypothetical protein